MSALTSTAGSSIQEKPPAEKWLFSEDELINTPSRRDNVPAEKELNYRQQAANLIQDMGQRLPVNQLTINTAIVYMHRFYMFHSFQAFSRFIMAPSALFLAAKVEEQPKKLEHVIRVCHGCLHPDKPHLDVHSDSYLKQAQQLVEHELIMLQTLGFDISIDHPHTHVVKCTQLVKASRDLSQMAYFMATNSLHLTTFCLKYKPTVVSAMCIHLSCKWSNYEIPLSHEGKAYWAYMDPTITEALLENIIKEFLKILNLCPTRLRKLKNYRPSSKDGSGGSTPQSRDGQQPRSSGSKVHPSSRTHHSPAIEARRPGQHPSTSDSQKKPPAPIEPQKKPPSSITIAEYKNKREKELQQAKPNTVSGSPQMKPHASSGMKPPQRPNHPPTSAPPHGHQVKTEPHANKHPPKVPANHHKRPDKQQQHPHALKPSTSGAPSGPHRHKHPAPSHGPPAHQHKEHVKMQSKEQHHRMPHPTHHQRHPQQKPREHIVPKTEPMLTETSPRTHNPPPNTGKSDDNLLAGIEQQVMEQIKAEKAKETFIKTEPGSSGLPKLQPFEKPITSHPTKDPKSRHSLPNAPTSSHPQAPPVGKTYKLLYEQYKKNPDALKQQLKHKAQSEPLTEEEKQIWHKLKKKEEDKIKKKRKHEKQQKLHRSQPVEGTAEKGKSTPGGGPLTVRIKLPLSARAEMSKSQGSGSSGLHIGSSSGSGSEAMLSSPGSNVAKLGRKRTHAHDSGGADPISAKHSRKSEGHHHQSHQHHSSHESSRHRHRHSRPGSHHHSKSQQQPPGHKIDDSTFQQALNNAVSMVQSGQAAPGTSGTDKPVPTVTLKRTGVQNGSGDYAHSSRHDKSKATKRSKQLGFDPSAPVSATPPEDLFDADGGEHSKPENYNVLAPRNAELSSPETGEIHDDDSDASPLREHVLQQNYTHRQGTASNNNSGHRNQQWPSSSGGIHQQHSNQRPPNLTHGKHDGRKNYDNRMPTMPSLTSKPNRTEQR